MISEGLDAPLGTFAVALWRLNELTLLLPPTIWLDHGWRVSAQRRELYDEPHIWMDGRGDGRGDMDLDGDRRTGGVLLVVVINKVSNKKS